MNLRDYAGAFLIEENHTQLYYGIRAIRDYLDEGILKREDLSHLPVELKELITGRRETIDEEYRKSSYDIYKQYLLNADKYSKEDWEDLFVLTRLGHYDVHEENVSNAISYYNSIYNSNISSIEEAVDSNDEAQLARLHNRISPMEKRAYQKCLSRCSELCSK